jgi:hypothetical protein
MRFWSGYERFVRDGVTRRIWIRRAACPACRVAPALLPSFVLLRRLDTVEVIGAALDRAVAGEGMRTVAVGLGVPHTTARGWRRRFAHRAPMLTAGLAALTVELAGSAPVGPVAPEAAALAALGAVWIWARQRIGVAVPGRWPLAALVSGGGWLAATTSPPWAALGRGRWIPPVP